MKHPYLTAVVAAVALTLVGGTAAAAGTPDRQGSSSSAAPYMVGAAPSVKTTAILTAGDTVGGYTFAGLPDGLGAFDNGDGTFTVLANHEIGAGAGAVRAHGANGAFVSKLTITNGLTVVKGEDLIQRVKRWDGAAWADVVTSFSRFCSANLVEAGAFYDAATGTGTNARIYMTGEETGVNGRATATVVDGADAGTAYILPWMGRTSFENLVAVPGTGRKTVVIALDDSTPGQVYVYVGEKKSSGNDIERAGLTHGKLYGVKLEGIAKETDATVVEENGVPFSLVELPDAATLSGDQLEALGTRLGVTAMNRPEDGASDPTDNAGFYIATTASFKGRSRLWHLGFADIADPAAGGLAKIAVEGPAFDPSRSDAEQEGPRMMDNITVNDRGQVLMQEDPGNSAYLSGIFQYDPRTGSAVRVARHDAAVFTPGEAGFITQDEESSGIIPVPFLGAGKYLFDSQVHKTTGDPKTVEQGQLLLLQIAPGKPIR
jgi:hypothetical protein